MIDKNFYINPNTYDIIKYSDDIDWDYLSEKIQRNFTKNEIRLFYDKINFPKYLEKETHDITDEDFMFLKSKSKISFISRYHLVTKPDRINDSNICMICAEAASLWKIAIKYGNNISESVLIENFSVFTSTDELREIIVEDVENGDEKYRQLLLLLDLNN